MATAQSRLTSTDTHAYFDRSKHVDRLEVNAYFGRSKTTSLKNFMTLYAVDHSFQDILLPILSKTQKKYQISTSVKNYRSTNLIRCYTYI